MVISKEQIIKEIANSEGENIATVRKLYNRMEDTIFDYLSFASPTENVTVKIFSGLSMESKFVPEQVKKHPATQEEIVSPEKIHCKAKLTRYFNRKINEYSM